MSFFSPRKALYNLYNFKSKCGFWLCTVFALGIFNTFDYLWGQHYFVGVIAMFTLCIIVCNTYNLSSAVVKYCAPVQITRSKKFCGKRGRKGICLSGKMSSYCCFCNFSHQVFVCWRLTINCNKRHHVTLLFILYVNLSFGHKEKYPLCWQSGATTDSTEGLQHESQRYLPWKKVWM